MSFTREEFVELKSRFLDRMEMIGSASVVAREFGINIQTAYSWARHTGLKSRCISLERKAEYFALRQAGYSQAAAARKIEVNVRTCRDWDHGTVHTNNSRFYADGRRVNYSTGQTTIKTMTSTSSFLGLAELEKELHPRFLTLAEREQIADLRREGFSLQEIGRRPKKSASTIKREIDHYQSEDGVYQPFASHRRSTQQRSRPKPSKLAQPGKLHDYVVEKLQMQWSAGQISHKPKIEYPDNESTSVSTETNLSSALCASQGRVEKKGG